MMPRERAEQVVDSQDAEGRCKRGKLIYAIEQAITAAVEEEREACAQIADEEGVVFMEEDSIATRIRARSTASSGETK